jgi:hypothetical protein
MTVSRAVHTPEDTVVDALGVQAATGSFAASAATSAA